MIHPGSGFHGRRWVRWCSAALRFGAHLHLAVSWLASWSVFWMVRTIRRRLQIFSASLCLPSRSPSPATRFVTDRHHAGLAAGPAVKVKPGDDPGRSAVSRPCVESGRSGSGAGAGSVESLLWGQSPSPPSFAPPCRSGKFKRPRSKRPQPNPPPALPAPPAGVGRQDLAFQCGALLANHVAAQRFNSPAAAAAGRRRRPPAAARRPLWGRRRPPAAGPPQPPAAPPTARPPHPIKHFSDHEVKRH